MRIVHTRFPVTVTFDSRSQDLRTAALVRLRDFQSVLLTKHADSDMIFDTFRDLDSSVRELLGYLDRVTTVQTLKLQRRRP
jgi:hypothetical protein